MLLEENKEMLYGQEVTGRLEKVCLLKLVIFKSSTLINLWTMKLRIDFYQHFIKEKKRTG
jgi:hypothetical protein